MTTLIRITVTAALAAVAATSVATMGTAFAIPSPAGGPDVRSPGAQSGAEAGARSQTVHYQRYCDDGGTYQTHKLTDDGPAFIEGTREKFINVDADYDGSRRVYTCSYAVIGHPEFNGVVQSIRVHR